MQKITNFSYKMICSDIDGTLLDINRTISVINKNILCRIADDLQIPIILVSARMPKGMRYLQALLNINQPIICYNGALVEGARDEHGVARLLINKTIPAQLVHPIYTYCKTLNPEIHIGLFRYDTWFVETIDTGAEKEINNTKAIPQVANLEKVIRRWEDEQEGPHKIMLIGRSEDMDVLENHLRQNLNESLHIYRSKSTYLEINVKSVSKASAIRRIQKNFGVRTEEIVAFGDNYNDIEMLQYAGLGVAMGNAPDAVKKFADEVTASNLEDGIASTLNKYLLPA